MFFNVILAVLVVGVVSNAEKSAPSSMGAPASESIEELVKFETKGDCRTVIARLDQIPLALRGDEWLRLLNQCSLKVLEGAEKLDIPAEAHFRAEDLVRRFVELKKNRDFMSLRAQVGVRFIKKCFENKANRDRCYEKVQDFAAQDPENTDLYFDLGKVVRDTIGEKQAIAYFDKALVTTEYDRQKCNDESVKVSIINTLGLPAGRGSSNGDIVKIAVRISSSICWSNWQETLQEIFAKDRHNFQVNTCQFMREKKAITIQQARRCM